MKAAGKHITKWDLYAAAAMAVLVVLVFHAFIFSNAMIFGSDMVPMGYMMRKVVADYWRENHTIPVWNPYILCGLPVVDAMHGDLFYPAALLYLLAPLHKALGYKIVLHVWLAGMAMYTLLRILGLKRRSAFCGGLAYMLAPYFLSLTYAGHDGKMFVTALFPLCVAGLELVLRYVKYIYAVVLGGLLGLLFLTSHPQMTYFAMWGLAIYLFFGVRRLTAAKRLGRGLAYLGIALAIGVGIGCIQFLPTYFYTTNLSPRTGGVTFAFASSWSLHPEEIVSLLLPAFVGYSAGQGDSYWGRNPFKLNAESPGPLVLLLAIGGLVLLLRRREVWPWIFLFFFCPLYALGAHTPLLKAAFYAIPGAKFLRAPSIIMFMFSASSAVLAAMFLDSLLGKELSRLQKRILSGLLIALGAALVIFTVGSGALFGAWQGIFGRLDAEKLATIRRSSSALTRDALLLVAFGGLALGVAASRWRAHFGGKLLPALVIAGVMATSLPHSLKFITYVNDIPGLRNWLTADPALRYVKEDKEIFRALPLTGSSFYDRDYAPIFGIQTANGFYDNRSRYYETLTGPSQENLINPNIMRITNVKYVLTAGRVEHPLLALAKTFGQISVYRNRAFLPRAFIVHNAVVAESDSAALELIKSAGFDPATTIVLAGGEATSGQVMSGEARQDEWVKIEKYLPGEVILRAHATERGYVFFSENYLPYWKAYVDGVPAPLARCDVAMRAIRVDAGDHVLEMKFSSKWYKIGVWAFLLSLSVVAGSVVICLRLIPGRSKNA